MAPKTWRYAMRLTELIKAASDRYPDGMVMQFFRLNYTPTGRRKFRRSRGPKTVGDTLAAFIVLELVETFEPDGSSREQIDNAVQKLAVARNEIGLAMYGLRT
jgi:hypothetical protein